MKKEIKEINTTQKTSIRKAVKAVMYNKITDGDYEGWFAITELIPPEGAPMSIWTKEQEAYLDRRFDPIERDVKDLKKDVKDLKEDMVGVKSDIKEILEILRK